MKAIQTTLSELGWYTGPIDGAYGPVTAEAVAGLQAQLGVTPDGILGPETFAAFESQCQPNPSPCEKPATSPTTVPATTGATQAPTVASTSPSSTTTTGSTTTTAGPTTTSQTTSHHRRLDDDVDRIAATSTPAGVTCVWGQSGRRKGPPGARMGWCNV